MHQLKITALILTLIFYGCGNGDEKKGGEKKGDMELSVEGMVATEEFFENSILSTGTVMANDEVELRSEISGKITRIFFQEGAAVSSGQLLVKLNDNELQAQLKKLEFEKKLLEEKESRQKQLLKINAISQEEYDASLNGLNVSKANHSMLLAQIEKTEIRAPFSGTIGLKHVSEGAAISTNTLIASLQDAMPVKIDFSIPEKYNSSIKIGSKIAFTIEGSEEKLQATVYAREPKIDPTSRTLRVRALYPNANRNVLPGSFANVRIPLGQSEKVILVPTQALIPDISGAKVYIVKDGKALSKQVTTGLRTEKDIQILSGIGKGDTVLTTGILQLKPGVSVKISGLRGQ
jgi:membrane fusion protein (multidrug efflux system)